MSRALAPKEFWMPKGASNGRVAEVSVAGWEAAWAMLVGFLQEFPLRHDEFWSILKKSCFMDQVLDPFVVEQICIALRSESWREPTLSTFHIDKCSPSIIENARNQLSVEAWNGILVRVTVLSHLLGLVSKCWGLYNIYHKKKTDIPTNVHIKLSYTHLHINEPTSDGYQTLQFLAPSLWLPIHQVAQTQVHQLQLVAIAGSRLLSLRLLLSAFWYAKQQETLVSTWSYTSSPKNNSYHRKNKGGNACVKQWYCWKNLKSFFLGCVAKRRFSICTFLGCKIPWWHLKLIFSSRFKGVLRARTNTNCGAAVDSVIQLTTTLIGEVKWKSLSSIFCSATDAQWTNLRKELTGSWFLKEFQSVQNFKRPNNVCYKLCKTVGLWNLWHLWAIVEVDLCQGAV